MNLIAKTLHGSKLYRLDGPNSDTDTKGIYLPSMDDCLLMRGRHNVQSKSGDGADKQESETFSLQEFLRLAANAEDICVTMLHVQQSDVIVDSPIYVYLRERRRYFYTKRMAGSVGYAKSQASKFALRADRMEAVQKIAAILRAALVKGAVRVHECWDDLPQAGPYIEVRSSGRGNDTRVYEVAGKAFSATVEVQYALDILERLISSYGERVRAARSLNNRDFKSLAHSFRVGYQLKSIYETGDLAFPLVETPFLRDVKEQRLSYVDDKLDERLNDLITHVESLAAASTYPDTVPQDFLDRIVLSSYGH